MNPDTPIPASAPASAGSADRDSWWRQWQLADRQTLALQLGPLQLSLYRIGDEWQLGWAHGPEGELDTRRDIRVLDGPPALELKERYVFAATCDQVRLRPLLMERPVVIRPRQPLFLPSGQQTTLYLSTPLCLRIELGPAGTAVRELPMLQLSDTWFGPSTREGELCYAGRTHARHSLDEVPRRAHRAITPVRIHNQASTVLPLEKLSLPVPALALYGAADGSLWTQSVSLIRGADSDLASLRIDRGAPGYVRRAELVTEARRPAERGTLVRAFSVLFGE